jgi:hypothetical protein
MTHSNPNLLGKLADVTGVGCSVLLGVIFLLAINNLLESNEKIGARKMPLKLPNLSLTLVI